ncbi:MAG TPA: hypothetical protein DCS85_02965, partial [Verrucomicrobiales bacterium]|nr:hypothetical protein [Verrucomicrobiales bacterium]
NVLSQISSGIGPVEFSVTTDSPLTVGTGSASVTGSGWVNVREIRVHGGSSPLSLSWSDTDSWEVALPLLPGRHIYTLDALDFSGNLVGSDSITIDNTSVIPPASDQNLAITEIHYRPGSPTIEEEGLGFDARSRFEFVELMNISSGTIDLTNVRFTEGIRFNFTESLTGVVLAAGERIAIVNDLAAFSHRYPAVPAAAIAGEFTGNLSDGGEALLLMATDETTIRSFTYGDLPPWPAAADGLGPSLVLVHPEGNPDHGDPLNWRSSVSAGGNPDASDAVVFAGNANADRDSNGLPDLIDHVLGNLFLPEEARPTGGIEAGGVGGVTEDYFTFSYRRNLAADDVIDLVEVSEDLENWNSGSGYAVPVATVNLGDGTALVTWRAAQPTHRAPQLYFRLRSQLR